MNKCKNYKMDQNEYSKRRDELICIFSNIQEAIQKKPEMEEKYFPNLVETLSARIKKLSEDQFKMVLCGAFQGGKSTTFNAICNGRDLSPTGFGIKTSACLVEAHYLSDASAEEYAKIYLRSASDIVEGFQKVLGDRILNYMKANGKEHLIKPGVLSFYFDVFNNEYLDILSNVVDEELKLHEENRSSYSSERLDILKYAKIVVDAIKSGKVKKEWIESKSYECTIDEAKASLKFPADFSSNWKWKNFSLEEIKWAFISKVELHLKGVSRMAEFGFVLVDAPGLFTSDWDSNLTLTAINNADAVLFIISGDKEIDKETIRAIKKIRNDAQDIPMFLGFNQKTDELATRDIINSSILKLHEAGLDFKEDEYTNFHARLSLNLLLYKESDDLKLIRNIKNDASNCYDIDILKTKESVAENESVLTEKASLDKLVSKGSNFIAKNRGAIVLTNNVDNVLGVLKEARDGRIKSMLDSSIEQKEQNKQKLEEEEVRYENFKEIKNIILSRRNSECIKLVYELEDLFYNKIKNEFDNYLNSNENETALDSYYDGGNVDDSIFSIELYDSLKKAYNRFLIKGDINDFLRIHLNQVLNKKLSDSLNHVRYLLEVKNKIDDSVQSIIKQLKNELKNNKIYLIQIDDIELANIAKISVNPEITVNKNNNLFKFYEGLWITFKRLPILGRGSDAEKCYIIVKRIFREENLEELKKSIFDQVKNISNDFAIRIVEQLYNNINSFMSKKDEKFSEILKSLKSDFDKSDTDFQKLQETLNNFSIEFLDPTIAKLETYKKNL